MNGVWPADGGNAPGLASVAAAAEALLEALDARDAGAAGSALAALSGLVQPDTRKTEPAPAVALAWAACAQALDAPIGPEACTNALLSLASLAQACPTCSGAAPEDWASAPPAQVALRALACVQRHPGHPGVQAAACSLYAGLAACAGCPCADGAALAEMLGGAAGVAALLQFPSGAGADAGGGATDGDEDSRSSSSVDAETQERRDLLDQEYERALEAQPGSGGSTPVPPGIAVHRPPTPDGMAQQHDGTAWGGGSGRSSSEDSGSEAAPGEAQPRGWAPPALGAFLQRGPPAPAATPLRTSSSIFGGFGGSSAAGSLSPRADMPLFGSPSPGATLTAASSYGSGSPFLNTSPSLAPLPPPRTDLPLSARLQDALFVHDAALGGGASASAGFPSAGQTLQHDNSLFASLRSGAGAASSLLQHEGGTAGLGARRRTNGRGSSASSGSGGTTSPGSSSATGPSHRSGGGSVLHGVAGWGGEGGAAADALFASLSSLQQRRGGLPRPGHASDGSDGSDGGRRAPDAAPGDESSEPTRHLWIGNLGTRTPRAVLKALFDRYGCVDDVVTFPGRMYAFVNYRTADEAARAAAAMHDRVVPELTGDRRLLLKYRPANKAAAHLRALGGSTGVLGSAGVSEAAGCLDLGGVDGVDVDDGFGGRAFTLDREGNCSQPSPRIWLGNIAPTASSKVLQAVLSRFGPLTDAAVFPARIGPLGYAFVKFESVSDAVAAFEALNNTVVPPLSGSKQLKMRYKPAGDGPAGRDDANDTTKASMVPSRHLWLGNVTQKPTDQSILDVFGRYGRVDSVRIFPAKAYAFVNFTEVGAAARAMAELDGLPVAPLTGVKPLVMRYQQESHPAVVKGGALMQRVHSDSALALAAQLGSLATAAAAGPGMLGGYDAAALGGAYGAAQPAARGAMLPHAERDALWASTGLGPAAAGLGAAPRGGIHRSQSMGLLGVHQQQAAAAHGLAGRTLPGAAPAGAFGALLGMPQHAAGLGGAASGDLLSLQRSHSASLAGLLPHQPAASGPASASQLSAVLSNLAALQRAGSFSNTGTEDAAASVQQQLLQLGMMQQHQQQQLQPATMAPGPDAHDIARLSSLLAGQSLSSPLEAPMPPLFPMAGPQQAAPPAAAAALAAPSGLPAHLLCPLSGQIMVDPVIAADGVTYNRAAIAEWMASRAQSPMTNAPLAHTSLSPNDGVKGAVVHYLRTAQVVAA